MGLVMYTREKEISATNNRSLINSSYWIQDNMGVIGIYGTDNERFIYIESGKEKRTLERYSIQFENDFLSSSTASDNENDWELRSITPSFQAATTIARLREQASIRQEFQATGAEIEMFKDEMEIANLFSMKGEQDEDINNALKAISRDGDFVTKKTSCVIL
jgi:hypothetical protein